MGWDPCIIKSKLNKFEHVLRGRGRGGGYQSQVPVQWAKTVQVNGGSHGPPQGAPLDIQGRLKILPSRNFVDGRK